MGELPERTCVGCGRKRPKAELIRLVLRSQGQPEVDRAQRAAGRGAYLCGPGCLKAALKRKAFSRAFRGKAAVDEAALAATLVALTGEKS